MARFRLRLLTLLSLLFILCSFGRIARAYDFPPITDEDKNFKEVPGQPGAPAAMLYREEIDDDFKNHDHTTYVRIKILTEAGRSYADVNVPFFKSQSNIESVVGRTVHADGTIVPFDGKVLDKEVVKGHDYKIHVKTFTLPDVQVGSIIEYRYIYRYGDHQFVEPYWKVQGPLWIRKAYFKFLPAGDNVQLILQHGLIGNGVAWVYHLPENGTVPKEVRQAGDVHFVELKIDSMPAFIDEPYMPDNDQFRAYVHFFYRVPEFKGGTFWHSEGKYWNKEVEKFIGKGGGIDQALTTIVAPTDSPEDKVKKIYAFIGTFENQNYRPARSTQEIKALGMRQEVRGASDVLQQKSGDREELTRLFVAMVRHAGIPANVMTVTSREDQFFLEGYLSAEQLDAEIAIVQLNGKDVFLDPGTKYCPYGQLDWRHTATRGLRQTGDGADLADTPNPKYTDAQEQRIGTFVLKDDGSLEGTLKVGYFGQRALARRHSAIRKDAEGRKKELEDEVKAWLPEGSEVKLANEPKWDTAEGPLVAEFKVSTTAASNAGKRVLLPAMVCQLMEKPKFPASQRSNGIYLYYPWSELDQISVTVPASLDIETLPQPETAQTEYAIYKTKWSQDGRTISVRRDLAMAGFVFPQARYPELKGFFDKVKTGDEQQAILKVNANAVGK